MTITKMWKVLAVALMASAFAIGSTAGGGAAAATTTTTTKGSGLDKDWLKSSIQSDRFEIAAGKLAQQRSETPAVQGVGQALVVDHSKSLDASTTMAKQ